MANQLDQLNNLKVIKSQAPPAAIPPPPPQAPRYDSETIQAQKLNEKRDLNRAHPFQFWVAYQNQINDFGNYSKPGVPIYKNYSPDMHAAVLRKWKQSYVNSGNGQVSSSFYGSDGPKDFTNWSEAEIYYYSNFSDFLGINFKKIFHGIGHAIGWAGSEVGHAAKFVVHEADQAHKWVGHEVADAGKYVGGGIAHVAKPIVSDVKRSEEWFHGETKRLMKVTQHDVSVIGHALEPYWKVIVTVGLVALAIGTLGIAAPLAITAGVALLTGLDSIKDPEPPQGGGSGIGPDNGGGPGFLPDGTDDGGGPSPEDVLAQQQQQAQAQAEYQEALKRHRKRVVLIVATIIVVVIIGLIIWHHKKHKK